MNYYSNKSRGSISYASMQIAANAKDAKRKLNAEGMKGDKAFFKMLRSVTAQASVLVDPATGEPTSDPRKIIELLAKHWKKEVFVK